MTDKQNYLDPSEIKDTYLLQVTSLKNFLYQLGYEPVYYVNGIVCFESDLPINKGRSTISFATAVRLHNGYYLDNHGKTFKQPFNFNPYMLKRALAARIVVMVNLQKNRKTGIIKPSSQIVKFVEPAYYKMFINSKTFPF
jgi:hypothetical protein